MLLNKKFNFLLKRVAFCYFVSNVLCCPVIVIGCLVLFCWYCCYVVVYILSLSKSSKFLFPIMCPNLNLLTTLTCKTSFDHSRPTLGWWWSLVSNSQVKLNNTQQGLFYLTHSTCSTYSACSTFLCYFEMWNILVIRNCLCLCKSFCRKPLPYKYILINYQIFK